MRIALDIADDVLMAVKDRARRQKRSVGDLLSELAREALTHQSFYGFDPFPSRGRPVSNELIDKLREEDPGCS